MSVHYCVCINYRYKRKSLVQIAEMELMAFKRDGIEKTPTSPSLLRRQVPRISKQGNKTSAGRATGGPSIR